MGLEVKDRDWGNAYVRARKEMIQEKPQVCFCCKETFDGLERHHVDYNRPYVFFWLCRQCHGKMDALRRREEEERGVFPTSRQKKEVAKAMQRMDHAERISRTEALLKQR